MFIFIFIGLSLSGLLNLKGSESLVYVVLRIKPEANGAAVIVQWVELLPCMLLTQIRFLASHSVPQACYKQLVFVFVF